MADPSKPDDQETAEGLEALHRPEDRANDSTVPAEPETLTSPRPSGPYLDDETRELFGFYSNAEEQRIEGAEAQRLALVQRAAHEAAKRRTESQAQRQYHPINDMSESILRAGLSAEPKSDPKAEDPRGTSEPQPPRTQKVSRVVAGGLFALFLGSITQALQLFGLINATSGHVFMFIAFVVGILIITTEVLPLKPTKHKVAAIIVLAVLLGAIDAAASLYANKRDAGKASSGASPAASQPMPEELQDNVFLSEKYPSLGNPKTFTFFGDRNYGSVSFQARFGLSTNFAIILLVHSTEPEPGIAVGDCLTAINNYQAIVDNLKVEAKKRSPEFIDFIVTPNLVCHYEYATEIPAEKVEALKRIALGKNLVLSIIQDYRDEHH